MNALDTGVIGVWILALLKLWFKRYPFLCQRMTDRPLRLLHSIKAHI
jgi:hypothetical protein